MIKSPPYRFFSPSIFFCKWPWLGSIGWDSLEDKDMKVEKRGRKVFETVKAFQEWRESFFSFTE